jgi:glycosyltransferase involved in cell wall biosynthesis
MDVQHRITSQDHPLAGPIVMLLTPNLDVGGAQEMLRTLASYLPRVGCPAVVCSFEDGPLRHDVEDLGVPIEILSPRRHSIFELRAFVREMRSYRRRLRRLVDAYGIEAIITKGLGTLDFLVMTLRRRDLQIWWTIENTSFELRPEHLPEHAWSFRAKRGVHRLLYRLGRRIVNGVIAVSDETSTAFRTIAGEDRGKVVVVCNAVDTERYPAAIDREAFRSSLGIRPGEHVMTMVGTFKRQKGHTYLIRAMAEVVPEHPELHILLAGDGELRPNIEGQVRADGLQGRVTFLGTRRDVPEILAASDSFILPSLWEGLPVALVEAMATGLPLVATVVSGTSQVVTDGVDGLLVPPGDVRALAAAMRRILADPVGAAGLGTAARSRVVSSFGALAQAHHVASLLRGR